MLAIAILAAGKGTRMHSNIPKVLQKIAGTTLLERVLNSCKDLRPDRFLVIVGHQANTIQERIAYKKEIEFITQEPQNGTGHAVQQLIPTLKDFTGDLLVLNGDVPLLRSRTLLGLVTKHRQRKASVSMLSARLSVPEGYGRIFSDSDGYVEKIIEHCDCSEEEKRNNLTNSGVYCFKWKELEKVLQDLSNNNAQNEIYLTDAIQKLSSAVHIEISDSNEVNGVNDKQQLSDCENALQERLRSYWMKKGVNFINPKSSTISESSFFGKDVTIEPDTHLRGENIIGDNCHLGPNSFIENTELKENVSIFYSVVKDSLIHKNVQIGPFSHIRPGSLLNNDCKIGNFVEIKKSHLDSNTKVNHLSYLGDCQTGKDVNIGAGTITANFDGLMKHQTIIGKETKTGANSVLVAPIKIGERVTIGAGSTIIKDVPDNSLALERSKQITKKDWSLKTSKS